MLKRGLNAYQIRLEKFMAEVYQQTQKFCMDKFLAETSAGKVGLYFEFTPENFELECAMMLSVQDQILEERKEGYV